MRVHEKVDIPFVEWEDFYPSFTMGENAWRQGEHVAILGRTGTGKTTLQYHILPQRKYVVMMGTKPRDPSLDRLVTKGGFKKITKWNPKTDPRKQPKRLLWPPITNLQEHRTPQGDTIATALFDIYGTGGWCVSIDENYYVSTILKLEELIRIYLLQARSNGISLVLASQRPRWVPLETYSQSTHMFFFSTRDEDDLSRIGGIASHDPNIIRQGIRQLEKAKHEFLYVNQDTGTLLRSSAPNPEGR